MKIKKIYLVILFALLMSCEDYLEKYPLDSPSSSTFPLSKDELVIAINGAYRSLHFVTRFMQLELYMDGATDLNFIRDWSANMSDIVLGTSTPTTEIYSLAWKTYYGAIQRCNFIIGNMPRARENIDEATCDRIEAEAKFLRAWHYMRLTELYGDVPMVSTILTLENSINPRKAKSEVVDFIFSDLDYAASKLPETFEGANSGRATKGAALATKARVALYNKKYDIAASAAQAVMGLGYELHPNYGDLFQLAGNNSSETIFQLSYHMDVVRNYSSLFMYSRLGGGYSVSVPTQWLVDSYLCTDGKSIDKSPLYNPAKPFENRDPRLKQSLVVPQTWFGPVLFETHPDSIKTYLKIGESLTRVTNLVVTNPYATFTGYLWRKNSDETKYKDVWTTGLLSFKLIRYAEVLLTYAEAKIELNQIDASLYSALNQVRGRANMPDVETGLSQDELRKVIRNERKIELAGEGFRLSDIRRWEIAEHVLNGNLPGRKNKDYWYNPGIPVINEHGHPIYTNQDDVFKVIQVRSFDPSRDYLWPIPQKEMDINDQLVQNPNH